MACSYSTETAIRRYHVYGAVCNARLGEVLCCKRELDTPENEFALAVKLQDCSRTTLGHILRELSRLVWQENEVPLVQGGLKIPYVAKFTVTPKNFVLSHRKLKINSLLWLNMGALLLGYVQLIERLRY